MADWFGWLLILDALAVFYVVFLVTSGGSPLSTARERAIDWRPDSPLAKLITCPWCFGFWTSAAVVALHALLPAWWPYAAAVLAFSAVAGLLATWEQRD